MDLPAVTVGVDFGTLSGRALVVAVEDGTELGSSVVDYAHAIVDDTLPNGRSLPSDWALQIPEDWRDVLRLAVPRALRVAGVRPEQVVGIATDFTACTVLPATVDGTPLCELPSFADRPHAYPKLWRHHAAQPEADAIVHRAEETGQRWLARYGGRISSEWQFAKALQVLREDPEVYAVADRWIEAADWIVWQLVGAENRNLCTAGYKGIHQDGAYPDAEFLASLHPDFGGFVAKLDHPLSPLGAPAGKLSAAAAELTGLREGTVVAVGNVDAHVTGAAARALEPGHMLAIMGTSTCHIMNSDVLAEVPGMCGVVRDGVVAQVVNNSARVDVKSLSGSIRVAGAYTFSTRFSGVTQLSGVTRAATRATFPRLGPRGVDSASRRRFFTPYDLMVFGFNPVVPAYAAKGESWRSSRDSRGLPDLRRHGRVQGARQAARAHACWLVHRARGALDPAPARLPLRQRHPDGAGSCRARASSS